VNHRTRGPLLIRGRTRDRGRGREEGVPELSPTDGWTDRRVAANPHPTAPSGIRTGIRTRNPTATFGVAPRVSVSPSGAGVACPHGAGNQMGPGSFFAHGVLLF
jgi:hypothetical protein